MKIKYNYEHISRESPDKCDVCKRTGKVFRQEIKDAWEISEYWMYQTIRGATCCECIYKLEQGDPCFSLGLGVTK